MAKRTKAAERELERCEVPLFGAGSIAVKAQRIVELLEIHEARFGASAMTAGAIELAAEILVRAMSLGGELKQACRYPYDGPYSRP